jgi:hypothetical protein
MKGDIMAAEPSVKFITSINDSLSVSLYGKKITDLVLQKPDRSPLLDFYKQDIILAQIYGARVLGQCKRLPVPLIAFVPNTGEKPSGCDEFNNPDEYTMWVVPNGGPLVVLSSDTVNAAEVIRPRGIDVQADFHFHDVTLNGTVLSASLRSYLKLHCCIWSACQDIVVVDRDDRFSWDFSSIACYPIYSIGVATAQVCFHPNPNRICGEVVVGIDLPLGLGHWGQTFTIACVNI